MKELEKKISKQIPQSVKYIIQKLEKSGYEAYIVGGCVRDIVLDIQPHDYDICTSAKPNEVINVFKDNKTILTGIEHGTVTIIIDDIPYEITTYRIDGNYSDNRRPDNIIFSNDIYLDLQRRDFTINAIAYNPTNEIIVDPYNGLKDISLKQIKCVGNPYDRFGEDALRILRLWRFCIQLNFKANPETLNAAIKMIDNIKNISKERIQAEFIKAIKCDKDNFVSSWNSTFITAIIPEWKSTISFKQNNPWHIYDVEKHSLVAYSSLDNDSDVITRIATLLHDIGKPFCYQDDVIGVRHFKGHGKISSDIVDNAMKELKFDNFTREKVTELVFYHDSEIVPSKKSIKRWLNRIGKEQLMRLYQLKIADNKAQNLKMSADRIEKIKEIPHIINQVIEEESCFQIKDLDINGNDLIEMGIPKGKRIGEILNECLNAVIDEYCPNQKRWLKLYVEKLQGLR